MMKNSTNILDYSYTELSEWCDKYKNERKGWAYLKEPSPILLTKYYAKMVIQGDIPASEEIVAACERHLKDLDRQDTDDFPWVFDEKKAWRPIRFIKSKCKPSKGNMEQLVLQPWQHFVVGSLFGWVYHWITDNLEKLKNGSNENEK